MGEDSNLRLRCCAAVLAGDASPDTLVNLLGADVRARFREITNGLKGAIDFLRTNLRVQSVENLPFSTILVPLCVFFASPGQDFVQTTDAQRARLVRWFWRSCFPRRFSSGVLRHLKEDIEAMTSLKNGRPNTLGDFQVLVTSDFFTSNEFRINSVNTKTFILVLALQDPKSFVSGQPVSLAEVLQHYNRSEFHHLYPRAYLTANGIPFDKQNKLANLCFLSKADNTTLGGVAPSAYRPRMAPNEEDLLRRALCPAVLFDDDFDRFVASRATLLERVANDLLQ